MMRAADPRVRAFRSNLAGTGAAVGLLAVANALTTPHFPWFVLPVLPLGLRLARQWGALRGAGLRMGTIFGDSAVAPALGRGTGAPPRAPHAGHALPAPADLPDGPLGATVRRAIADHDALLQVLSSLGAADRALLPEVEPTATALLQRVQALAPLVAQLERECAPEQVAALARRLDGVRREPGGAAERERRLALMEHQQRAVRELAARAERARGQLERATLTLGALRLDLVRLRASGIQAMLAEVTQVTRQARALSRDIGHVLDAVREVRAL